MRLDTAQPSVDPNSKDCNKFLQTLLLICWYCEVIMEDAERYERYDEMTGILIQEIEEGRAEEERQRQDEEVYDTVTSIPYQLWMDNFFCSIQ